jgi:prolyl 4-hydroxylase
MTAAYQQIIEVLERRYYGEPISHQQLLLHAMHHAAFTEVWLSHAIASDASKQELAVVLALTTWHQLPGIALLQQYWKPEESLSSLFKADFLAQLQPVAHLLPEDIRQGFTLLHTSLAPLPTDWLALISLWGKICQCQRDTNTVPVANGVQLQPLPTAVKWLTHLPAALKSDFSRAGVYGVTSSDEHQQAIRDCGQFICPLPQTDVIFASFERQVAATTGQRLIHAEPLVILRYQPGEQFKWHCDFISSTHQQAQEELKMFGQRVYTSISYLNDDFTGGETEFKFWQRQIKPQQGMVLSFSNINEQGQVDKNSTHRGCPVLAGTKFVATSWYRSQRLWHREALMTAIVENETKR